MRVLKLMTICFAIFLFAGNAFAQPICFVGINPNIAGIDINGELALVAGEGDTIDYFLFLNLPLTNCPVEDITGFITLPDDTVVPLPAIPDLNPGDTYDFGGAVLASYVINLADLGSQTGADADEVRTTVNLFGTAITSPTTTQPAEGFSTFDTEVVTSCVEVTKTPDCDETVVGNNVVYTIRIENCGDTTLELDSITDTLFPGLVADITCETLAPGAFCEFQTDPYLITEADPDPLTNTVTVVYNAFVGEVALGQVDDEADAIVDILELDFTVTKECLTEQVVAPGTATFLVTIENTGEARLCFTTDDPEIAPFCLDPEDPPFTQEVEEEITEEDCTAGFVENTITVTANADEECLELTEPLEDEASATCDVICLSFTAEKTCVSDPVEGDFALFEIEICNTSSVDLSFEINDPAAGIVDLIVGPILAGACETVPVEVPAECVNGEVSNTATVQAIFDEEPVLEPQEVTAECPCGGQEGCTPGFWKTHPECWCGDYQPETLVGDVFAIPSELDSLADDTLLQAMSYKGGRGLSGAAQILLRAAAASLQNACNDNVQFPVSVDDVIEGVNEALASLDRSTIISLASALDFANNLGCPINAKCELSEEDEEAPM